MLRESCQSLDAGSVVDSWQLVLLLVPFEFHKKKVGILQVYQRGGWALFQVFNHGECLDMSCLQQLHALEANNWTNTYKKSG